jgi:hypothetical protein
MSNMATDPTRVVTKRPMRFRVWVAQIHPVQRVRKTGTRAMGFIRRQGQRIWPTVKRELAIGFAWTVAFAKATQTAIVRSVGWLLGGAFSVVQLAAMGVASLVAMLNWGIVAALALVVAAFMFIGDGAAVADEHTGAPLRSFSEFTAPDFTVFTPPVAPEGYKVGGETIDEIQQKIDTVLDEQADALYQREIAEGEIPTLDTPQTPIFNQEVMDAAGANPEEFDFSGYEPDQQMLLAFQIYAPGCWRATRGTPALGSRSP